MIFSGLSPDKELVEMMKFQIIRGSWAVSFILNLNQGQQKLILYSGIVKAALKYSEENNLLN